MMGRGCFFGSFRTVKVFTSAAAMAHWLSILKIQNVRYTLGNTVLKNKKQNDTKGLQVSKVIILIHI